MTAALVGATSLTLRPAGPADEPFLRALFAQSRDDLALLPDPVREPLSEVQYRARQQHYAAAHPQARQLILTHDGGASVGHLIIDESGPETRLVDLAVTAEHRGRGLGAAAVSHVLARAADRGAATTLSVWSANEPARTLYERLGFRYLSTGDGYLQMAAAPRPEVLA